MQWVLLCNTKGTEYESNSQQYQIVLKEVHCCCVIPKVLNMKAIHNRINESVTIMFYGFHFSEHLIYILSEFCVMSYVLK